MLFRSVAALMLMGAAPALAQSGTAVPNAVTADPTPDAAHPAGMDAFVLPVKDGAMNAVIYLAAGAGPHPTLLLLHGFPGNEQNLDLAQAARRAGWNVLTLHYRGSWGSPGSFSFTHSAEDAHSALAFLRDPATVAKYAIDPARIAVAGHSMGGFMAADAAADDKRVVGLFLIDAWNIGATADTLHSPAGQQAWQQDIAGNLPPLAGTSGQALTDEILGNPGRFDLRLRIASYGQRPIAIYGATRGIGALNQSYADAAKAAGNAQVTIAVWPTDHPFSDMRIALSQALVNWLQSLDKAN